MTFRGVSFRLGMVVAGAVLAATLVACGGGDDDGDNGGSTPGATAAATESNGEVESTSSPTLISKNTLFDKTELKSPAGAITLTHDNQDAGVVHNVRVYKGEDADGEDMGGTELEAGPIVQTLELNLEAGDYFFVCESHPATMAGTWEVE